MFIDRWGQGSCRVQGTRDGEPGIGYSGELRPGSLSIYRGGGLK